MNSTDLVQAYDRVWRAFGECGELVDGRHDTLQWRAHNDPFAACVVRVSAPHLLPAWQALRQDLEHLAGVRVHPDHFLHVMLQELGFVVDIPGATDEISAARLEEFAQATIEPVSATPALRLTLGGANAFQDAIFLEVIGGEALAQLHSRLFELAAIPGVPDFTYVPHCTVAHFDGTASREAVLAALTPWRQETMGTIPVDEVELVLLDPRQAYPELESFAVIPLKN